MELKIIEWNIKKGDKDKIKQIVEIIGNLEADVVVLTEVGATYRYFMEALSEQYFAVGSNNGGNGNNIIIAVSSTKIERVLFEDYYIYPINKGKLGERREHEKRNHPDRLLANVKLKKSNNWFKILGIRMQVSGLSFSDFEDQKEALKFEIEDADYPNVIIGDFNWFTAIESPKFDKELIEYIADKGYEMFPSSSDKDSFSFRTISNSDKHTSPDRVLYKKEPVTEAPDVKPDIKPDINPDKNHHYYHQELYDYKPYNNFSKGWPSDHDILVVTIKIPDKNE